jgi:hypothetical protein
MPTSLWFWIAFNAGVLCVLAIDLFGFQRQAHAPSTKEAAIRTVVWMALSLGFNALICFGRVQRRLVRVAWPFNCDICLGVYCSDLSVRGQRFPAALGIF